jgi:uncharacterized LabA/DUF88 family protein
MNSPSTLRAVAFVDGQNLFHSAKEAFGYRWPNYDVAALATLLCQRQRWTLVSTRFYTGVPDRQDDAFWHDFWTRKLAHMGRQPGVVPWSRALRYRNQTFRLPDGTEHTVLVGQEKGVDVRLALDIVRLALDGSYDVALVFSQDQDLREVAEEVRVIAREEDRWLKVASAFPLSPTSRNRRGIDKTDWLPIDRATYDACLDLRDYRGKSQS